jgi:hypothetical protein
VAVRDERTLIAASAERAMRPIAVGRHNWTFAGSDAGGERADLMYTLFETAKLTGLSPVAYLRQVISRIGEHPARRITELLPWNIRTLTLHEVRPVALANDPAFGGYQSARLHEARPLFYRVEKPK